MIKDYPLEGIRTYDINLLPDERGFFAEVLRLDWKDFISDEIVQVNLSYTYPGVVRAWHWHLRGQVDYFLVLKGAAKICGYDATTRKLVEIISIGAKPVLVRMPGHYYHGFKAIADEPTLFLYFVNRHYDYKNPDEERIPWNDPQVRPIDINGSAKDPRVNLPWDWSYIPNK